MSVGNRYRLPWDRLDLDRIDEAASSVVKHWPQIRFEREAVGGDRIAVYFHVPGELARILEVEGQHRMYRPSELDEHWAHHGYDGVTPVTIRIDFVHYPAQPQFNLNGYAELSFDTNRSGNLIAPNAAVEIGELIGGFFEVEVEPF